MTDNGAMRKIIWKVPDDERKIGRLRKRWRDTIISNVWKGEVKDRKSKARNRKLRNISKASKACNDKVTGIG